MDIRDKCIWILIGIILFCLISVVVYCACKIASITDDINEKVWKEWTEEYMSNKRYVIVGDTETSKGCLVMICGASKERAEDVLSKLISDPDEQDKMMIEGHINLRVEEVDSSDCWWED